MRKLTYHVRGLGPCLVAAVSGDALKLFANLLTCHAVASCLPALAAPVFHVPAGN